MGKALLVWETNADTQLLVDSLSMPVKKVIDVPLENNFTARVQLLLPPELADFNATKSYTKKYPLLVNV